MTNMRVRRWTGRGFPARECYGLTSILSFLSKQNQAHLFCQALLSLPIGRHSWSNLPASFPVLGVWKYPWWPIPVGTAFLVLGWLSENVQWINICGIATICKALGSVKERRNGLLTIHGKSWPLMECGGFPRSWRTEETGSVVDTAAKCGGFGREISGNYVTKHNGFSQWTT